MKIAILFIVVLCLHSGIASNGWSLGGDGLKYTWNNGFSVYGKPDLSFSSRSPFVSLNGFTVGLSYRFRRSIGSHNCGDMCVEAMCTEEHTEEDCLELCTNLCNHQDGSFD